MKSKYRIRNAQGIETRRNLSKYQRSLGKLGDEHCSTTSSCLFSSYTTSVTQVITLRKENICWLPVSNS